MYRHRVLLLFWLLTFLALGAGFLIAPSFAIVAQFSALTLGFLTARKADKVGVLRRTFVYRAAVGLLVAMTGVVLFSAGGTVVLEGPNKRIAGFVALASTNLVALVLAWRALVRPAPKRAAIVGSVTMLAELVALIFDVAQTVEYSGQRELLAGVAMISSFAAGWAGALVCVAVLAAFEPAPLYVVPNARVVDDD